MIVVFLNNRQTNRFYIQLFYVLHIIYIDIIVAYHFNIAEQHILVIQ